MPEQRRSEVVERIVEACRAGRQAYWVCPLIDESEELRSQAAEETAARLGRGAAGRARRAGAWPHARRRRGPGHAALQGRPDPAAGGHHGDRGRRGRAERDAHGDRERRAHGAGAAAPAARPRRPRHRTPASACCCIARRCRRWRARVCAAIRETSDGFEIARRDLELRGPGELLGTRQTGLAQLRVADLVRDADLLPRVQKSAELMLRVSGSGRGAHRTLDARRRNLRQRRLATRRRVGPLRGGARPADRLLCRNGASAPAYERARLLKGSHRIMSRRTLSTPAAIAVLSIIFFTWGALTCLNDVLIPHLKAVFAMNYAQTMLIQFTFFGTYFVMSIPSGRVVAVAGYKLGIIIGLLVAAVGALLSIRRPRCPRTRCSCWRCSCWRAASRCCRSPRTPTSACSAIRARPRAA